MNQQPEIELTKREAQELRLMLAMYRQGWHDAVAHIRAELSIEVKKVDANFEKHYQNLLNISKDLQSNK